MEMVKTDNNSFRLLLKIREFIVTKKRAYLGYTDGRWFCIGDRGIVCDEECDVVPCNSDIRRLINYFQEIKNKFD